MAHRPAHLEEEVIYIRPRLQVRITGPRRLLPRCAKQPAVKNYRGRKYVHWNGGLQVWSEEVRSPVGVWSAVYIVLLCWLSVGAGGLVGVVRWRCERKSGVGCFM
jgi:hypothetical protein